MASNHAIPHRLANPFIAAPNRLVPPWKIIVAYLLATVLVVAFFWASLAAAGIALNLDFVVQYRTRILDGLGITVGVSAESLGVSMLVGVPVALGQNSRVLPLRALCNLYVTVIRGTPLLVQIYLFYYVVGTAWGIDNRMVAGVLILSVFSGAYIAEIVRGAYASIDPEQIEAARAVGFTRWQTARHVILPQLVALALPALAGQFANIVKDSSLLSVISVIELTQTMREISATNYNFFGCYLLLGAIYLVLTLPIMALSRHLEKRLDYAG